MKVMLPLGSCVIQIKSLPYTRNQETNSINLKTRELWKRLQEVLRVQRKW